jgi:phosphohistidine phosphatase
LDRKGLDPGFIRVHRERMELFLLRHGIAAERGTEPFTNDSHRPLTAVGLKRTRKIARAIKALRPRFDLVLTSPYVRAKQTADIVLEVLELHSVLRLSSHLAPGAKPRALIAELQQLCKSEAHVLLVGHEPDLSRLASLLISGRTLSDITLKKAGLIKLQVDLLGAGRCASLEFLLTPRLLLRLEG